ncbi:MAG TPA: Asp23/Gls24 family envelope stress response protein [Deinococcales bacterium]|nr:Asp23/Gls24 family envelope stress response protein [Deinococcales bacterium]
MAGENEFSVDISKDVLVGIAGIALESVQGVTPVSPPVKVGEVLTGRRAKGIGVQREGNNVTVDLSVNIDFGRAIPDVARELQQAVADNIEVMTGLSVRSVNVTVQAVCLPAESTDA